MTDSRSNLKSAFTIIVMFCYDHVLFIISTLFNRHRFHQSKTWVGGRKDRTGAECSSKLDNWHHASSNIRLFFTCFFKSGTDCASLKHEWRTHLNVFIHFVNIWHILKLKWVGVNSLVTISLLTKVRQNILPQLSCWVMDWIEWSGWITPRLLWLLEQLRFYRNRR